MASYYEHYYDRFGAEVLRGGFMFAEMRVRAERVKSVAEAISPVDTGDYISSFYVLTGVTAYGGAGTRAFARVGNTSDHAAAVEYGYGNTPKYRVLGKSMHAAGGDVKGG